MLTIFISYSSKDLELAKTFRDYLKAAEPMEFDPILVEFERKPGQFFNEKVTKNIENCDVFIPLITENSLKSRWVNQEVGYAYSLRERHGIEIIPIVHDRNKMTKGFLNKYVGLPFVWDKENFTKTFEEVKEYMLKEIPYPIEIHEPMINIKLSRKTVVPGVSAKPTRIHGIESSLLIEHIGKREIKYIQIGIVHPPTLWVNSFFEFTDKSPKIPKAFNDYFQGENNLLLAEIYDMKPRTFREIVFEFYRPKESFHNGGEIEFGIYIAPEGRDARNFQLHYFVEDSRRGKKVKLEAFQIAKKVKIKFHSPAKRK